MFCVKQDKIKLCVMFTDFKFCLCAVNGYVLKYRWYLVAGDHGYPYSTWLMKLID